VPFTVWNLGALVLHRHLDQYLGAFLLPVFVMALFFGFIAMAIGAWTGNPGLASVITLGVMFVSQDHFWVSCLESDIWYRFTD
jgi:hypothetical protein